MAVIVSREQARRERLKEGGVSDETATAMGDVFASYGEDMDRRFDELKEEFSRKFNFHTTVSVACFAALALIIAAGAVSITVAIALKGG